MLVVTFRDFPYYAASLLPRFLSFAPICVEDGGVTRRGVSVGEIVCFLKFCDPTSVGMDLRFRLLKSGFVQTLGVFFGEERKARSYAGDTLRFFVLLAVQADAHEN